MTINQKQGLCDGCGLWSGNLAKGYCVECVRKQQEKEK